MTKGRTLDKERPLSAKQLELLDKIKETGDILEARELLNINRKTFFYWKEEDPEFERRCKLARNYIFEALEERNIQVALGKANETNPQAYSRFFAMKQHDPSFKDNYIPPNEGQAALYTRTLLAVNELNINLQAKGDKQDIKEIAAADITKNFTEAEFCNVKEGTVEEASPVLPKRRGRPPKEA